MSCLQRCGWRASLLQQRFGSLCKSWSKALHSASRELRFLQRAALAARILPSDNVHGTTSRRKRSANAIGCSRARGGFTSLTRSSDAHGLQWSTDAKSRAVLAVFTAVRDRDLSRDQLGLNWDASRPTGVNRDRTHRCAAAPDIHYDGAEALTRSKNDAARAAQAKTEQRSLFKKSSAYTCATRAAAVFTCAASPQPAHEARAPPPPPAAEREPAADRSDKTLTPDARPR